MKTILALVLAATLLRAEEPAPAAVPAAPPPIPSPAAVLPAEAPSATSAEPAPAEKPHEEPVPAEKPHEEPATSAKPVPAKAACGAAKPRREASLPSRVTLSDGSILKGTLRRRFLPADTGALGRIRIDLRTVESIVSLPASGDTPAGLDRLDRPGPQAAQVQQVRSVQSVHGYRITFRNGDRLTVGFPKDMKPLPFDTVIGRVFLPLPAVSRLVLEPPNRSTAQPSELLYHCTFDDTASIEHPVKGPGGKALGGTFVPGKTGKALRIPGNVPTALVDLPRGFLQPKGTIEFWSKIEDPPDSYGDRGNPRFFGLSIFDDPANPGPCCSYLQFTSNDGMGMSGLCGMIYHRAMATDPRMSTHTYGPLLADPAAWHHYAIVWDSDGLPFSKASDGTPAVATIVLDGRVLQTFGRNQFDKGKGLLRLPDLQGKLAFPVSDSNWGFFPRPIAFLIDEFKIWSVVKTDFIVSSTQPPNHHPTEPPKLLYHCTFDDAQSIERPAAGPNGKVLGGEFVPGKVGNALFVKAGTHAAEVPFPTGLMQPQGCIEFWGKIPGATKETTFPDGGNPTFFAMGVGKWVNTFVKYTSNDGFGTGGLHADLPGSAYISSRPSWSGSARYPDFLGDPGTWHHYALVWSDRGLDAASEDLGRRVVSALYVDGRLVNPAYGTNGPDRAKFLRQFSDLPVVLAFPIVPGRQDFAQNRVDYLIDDFKIWNFPKTDFSFAAQSSEPRLIYHCTFDDAAAIERPAAGPAGTFLGGSFVTGKKGNALRVEADTPAFEALLPRQFIGSEGCLEFWAKLEGDEASYTDGGDPQFLSLYNEYGSITHLQFAAHNGFGRGGLGGAMAGWPFGTVPHSASSMEYANTLGCEWAGWHHYAMAWKACGFGDGSFVKVFVDGRPQPLFGGVDDEKISARLVNYANHVHLFGIPWHTGASDHRRSKRPFLVDDLKIWSGAKTDFVPSAPISKPRLLYHCTFDDAGSIERPAAGPAGTFLGGEFVPGKIGNALRSPGDVPVAEVDLPRGMVQPRGTIEFWAKIEEPPPFYGDRGNPLFFGLWSFNDPADHGLCSTHLGFCANNGSGMAGLCGMVLHRTATTDPHMRTNTYGPILGDSSGWHHYAIVWDKDGLPFSKAADGTPAIVGLALDGRVLQTFGRNELARGEGLLALPRQLGKLAFPLPAARWSAPANHVPFLIDEFKIWSAPVVQTADSPGA